MQRFPDSSNADKIREFIKTVYVDKKYAGGKTSDKPPRDETRRASSYHSYSQSPPYDYQYEERRYGKQAFALTRKDDNEVVILVNTAYLYGSDTKNQSPNMSWKKKRLLKSQISLTGERRKRNITLLVKEVMGELEFVVEENAP
ncbi:hypothetical protein POM88_009470 [Heracleum sosnowskyi]|uniref:Uncharacterized protein n=1 Tax=Heracleum sosnowskyi TaxID=360622 RepID=A0AAD8J8E5_9APIA|nr:hypothetical protein POM88_009470 [Heracleum sosnowskyi]